jgi:divinyl chlorophyllide a 8-vinyl-reductase
MGNLLFDLMDKSPNFRRLPSKIFTIFALCLTPLAIFSKKMTDAQEFLRIANYYATESMLVYNDQTSTYDERLTPEFGTDTLENHYRKLLFTDVIEDDLGSHKLF